MHTNSAIGVASANGSKRARRSRRVTSALGAAVPGAGIQGGGRKCRPLQKFHPPYDIAPTYGEPQFVVPECRGASAFGSSPWLPGRRW